MNNWKKDWRLHRGVSLRLWVSEKEGFLEKVDILSWLLEGLIAADERKRDVKAGGSSSKTEKWELAWCIQGIVCMVPVG